MFNRLKMWGALAALLCGLGLPSSVHSAAQDSSIRPNQRIITFKTGVSAKERAQIIKDNGGTIVHDLGLINAVAAQFPAETTKSAESKLRARPDVVRIENDLRQKWIESSAPTFSDAELPSVGSIIQPFKTRSAPVRMADDTHVPWGVARVNAPAAWSATRGRGVKVVVIDTGIDFSHPQLQDHMKGGANLVTGMDPKNFMDDNGHGTHVSGIISASINDQVTVPQAVWGIAPQVDLYGAKVLDAGGSGTFSDVIAGIQWAADNKMDVANMSLGASEGTDALAEAVKNAVASGVVIVAAAGNSGGSVGYPAAYPQVIAISAIDNQDNLAYFSSRGPEVAFTAPGVDVPSLWMNDGYNTISGTSMACPHVSGLAALAVASKHMHGHDAVLGTLQAAATPLPKLGPTDQGAGLVDAAKLVQ